MPDRHGPNTHRAARPNPTLNRAAASGEPTEDEKLLTWCEPDRERAAAFKNTDTWRVLRIMGEFVEGFDELAELGRAVSVFGSARVTATDPMYELARSVCYADPASTKSAVHSSGVSGRPGARRTTVSRRPATPRTSSSSRT